jgi:processive 1,2-diacylglycerol beta-glucosyltransferase
MKITSFVVVTDFRAHPFWIEKGTDCYFVPHNQTKGDLIRAGILEEKIVVSGIPLRRGFYQCPVKDAFRHRFGWDEKPTLLFFSGDFAASSSLIHVLDELGRDFNFFVICGKNKKLKDSLNRKDNITVEAFPFYENIWELMNMSLAVITKPGGITVSESLHLKKPLVFRHYIWGQEKNNMDLLIEWGVGFYAPGHTQLRDALFFIRDNYLSIQDKFPPGGVDARQIIKAHLDRSK